MARDLTPGWPAFYSRGDYYDTQQVCENGHQVTDRYDDFPERRKEYCEKCGAKTIYKCPSCATKIRGHHVMRGAVGGGTTRPEYCNNCGSTFPWASKEQSLPEKGKDSSQDLASSESIELLARRLHLIAKQLQDRHEKRKTIQINDEYDLQDLVFALLRLYFDDIRPEEWTPSYAGRSSRMDFLLKQDSIVVETKMTRDNFRDRQIGEQLLIDIAKYGKHPHCKKLFCIVYDPVECVTNPKGLEKDLSGIHDGLEVSVIVTPRRS